MKRWVLIAIAAFCTAGFVALGVWQVERRAWKLALIERVEARAHATPVEAPGPGEWRGLTRENAEYRHVTLTGRFLVGRETRVRAVTELGEGFWLMAPMETDRGFSVLVNRGFVPQGWRVTDATSVQAARDGEAASPNAEGASRGADVSASNTTVTTAATATATNSAATSAASTAVTSSAATPIVLAATTDAATLNATPADITVASVGAEIVTVTGLLRITEPHGAFLRANAPADNRWYSRDVEAIANAQHLADTAPYFVDAEAAPGAVADVSRPPVPGLTVVQFRNSHLQYAITWFALALMALGLGVRVARNR